MTQKVGLLHSRVAAWTGVTQGLGSARTVKENTYMRPLHVAWASPILEAGFREEAFGE